MIFLVSHALCAQELPENVLDRIVARVDNYIVLDSDIESLYQNYLIEGNPPSREAKCRMVNRLVTDKLMVAKANIDSVLVTAEEVENNVDRRIRMVLQNSGKSVQELEQVYGKSMSSIKADIRDQIEEQMLSSKMVSAIMGGISVTPIEVRQFFYRIPKDSVPFYSASIEIAQIVRLPKISEVEKEKTKQALMKIRQRILQGEDFGDLAKQYSEDPSVYYNEGEMGYVGRGVMANSYEAMAFKTKEGEVSMPFESSFGIHILQLLDRRGNEYNSRHILMSPVPSSEDIAREKRYLDSLRQEIMKGNITFEDAVLQHSEDKRTKNYGGFFVDGEENVRVSVKEIEPSIYFIIDTMKVGTITKSIVYRNAQKKDAVRILYFKAKHPPHQANLKDDWHSIKSSAIADKQNRILNEWIIDSQKDVFISIDSSYAHCDILK